MYRIAACVAACAVLFLLGCGRSSAPVDTGGIVGSPEIVPGIKVLSNRADLISGGDALVEIVPPSGVLASGASISLNENDVTPQFALRQNHRYMALLSGLKLGENTLSARFPSGLIFSSKVTNHPSGGPIFAGPQPQPWVCQPGAVDAQCNQAPVYTYVYMSSALPGQMLPYDPNNPAPDVAITTTDQGVTVPFIVRVETGYIDRDQYTIKTLFQPGKPWAAWAPQPQWNHKLLITHGSSCSSDHLTGTAPADETSPKATWIIAAGKGFAVMSTALDNAGHNCNIATEAESLIMTKERLIEQYGEIRYTIGSGTSGGSLIQQQVANAYPGLYQGTIVTASFPDAWSSATQVSDYHLLVAYFDNPGTWGPGVAWTPNQISSVEGSDLPLNALADDLTLYKGVFSSDNACAGVTSTQLYNASSNPSGVRCSLQDYMINVFGPRPKKDWSAQEIQIGSGFAGRPIDNVGVQYGLSALQQGLISPTQFIDLNVKVGGIDIDGVNNPQRHVADATALANAYRTGAINETSHSNQVAIIDGRGPDPGLIHDAYRAFAIRARLDRAHGSHGNQLIWEGPVLYYGDLYFLQNALEAMDRWLSAVEKDTSSQSFSEKLLTDKPSDLTDRCYDGIGNQLTSSICPTGVVPIYGTPRTVAGDQVTTDTNKCQLKLMNRADDYGPIGFTDAQWSQLQTIFPSGVCDFSKPGVSQQATIPWLTYQGGDSRVIFGGKPLPAAPSNSGSGWASPIFGVFSN